MRAILAASVLGFVAACGQAPPPEEPAAPAAESATRALAALTLEPLSAEDVSGRLGGELGCSFRVGEEMLMLAMGVVASEEPSEALIKSGGAVIQLRATEPNGYDGMVEGATFSAVQMTAEVRVDGERETGDEQVAYDATLLARDSSAEAVVQGVWTCGP